MRGPRLLLVPAFLLSFLLAPASGRAAGDCAAGARVIEGLESLRDALPGPGAGLRPSFARGLERAAARTALRYADRCVRLNQLQVLGTHNSYHIEPVQLLIDLYLQFDPEALGLQYTHRPIPEQLDLGIRQLELDVFADPDGGLYSEPFGLKVREGDAEARLSGLDAPGFKVLHVQDLDWDTTCPTLVACLGEVKAWSDAHPSHLPIFILIELKDDPAPDPLGIGFVVPIPFGPEELDDLDAGIRSVFPPEQLITPDDVRGGSDTLEAAVLADAWPALADARGRVLFGLDNGGGKRDLYRAGRPSLEGRVLFTNAVPGDPDAAFVKVNGPIGNVRRVQDLVSAGYIVRTRADSGTFESRLNDPTRREAALASGAQFVSTDYPEPDLDFSDYSVEIPGGRPARCNPVNAPPGCRSRALEPSLSTSR